MIPVFVYPAVDALFELFEVQNPTDLILFLPCHINFQRIIVTVQIPAFPLMTHQAVTGTEGKSTHDTQGHDCLTLDFGVIDGNEKEQTGKRCEPVHGRKMVSHTKQFNAAQTLKYMAESSQANGTTGWR